MSKVYNYMVLAVGLTFLLKFAGIPSGADAFITWLGLSSDSSGVSMGVFFVGVAAVFAASTLVGGTIAIGFFTKSTPESSIVAPIALGIFGVITSTFVSVINYTKDMDWVYYVVWLIFVPLLVAFGVAIINFWRGSDG